MMSTLTWVLCVLFLSRTTAQEECPNLDVAQEWQIGMDATLPIKVDHELHAWTVTLDFDAPFIQFDNWQGEATVTGTHIEINSFNWDGDLDDGDILNFHFQLRFEDNGNRPKLLAATFEGEDACGGSPPKSTTEKVTTQEKSTTAKPNPTTTPEHITTSSPNSCDEVVIEESAESGNWHGLVVLSPKEDVNGWTVELAFTEEVDFIESPLAKVTGHGKTWTLSSRSFDEEIPAGGSLELRFIVDYSGAKPSINEVVFNGNILCGDENPDTTTMQPGTTATPEDCSDVVNIESQATASWTGSIILAPNEDITSWSLVFTFNENVVLISTPLADVTGQGTSWTLESKEWDGGINAGDTLHIMFEVDFLPGDKPHLISINFNGDELCGSSGPTSNKPPVTTTQSKTTLPPFTTPSPTPGKYNYKEVIAKSLLFYEANRSGKLPKDNRVSWRGDSALSDHITGGYYDAGDHVKFGFPMAAMTTILAWGAVSFPEGYEKSGQADWMVKCLKWSTDYFMAAHTSANEFYGQVGDGNADHAFWGRPEEMQMNRPAYKIDAHHPGSDLAGETAAALAASAMYFRLQGDNSYADDCLEHAKQLFEFAYEHRGVYTDSIPAGNFYNSWSGYQDELVWSAAWLAKATQENQYLDKAEEMYEEFDLGGLPSEFGWDDKKAGAQLLMYELTGNDRYRKAVFNFLNYMWSCDTTPKGLIWIGSSQWGSCRHASNFAHFAFQAAALGLQTAEALEFGESQINYILGDGGHSYVVGWGDNPPRRPHHRSSSCPDRPQKCDWEAFNNPGPNYQVLNGALVGGPDHNDNYVDDRNNFQSNEVATDYNAGFQSSLAALVTLHG